ncbi:LytTR family DNA-binding domain-containing protein [Bacillaceae bacterium]
MKTIKTIIAEDHEPSRKILTRFLEYVPDFTVVAQVTNGEDLVQAVMAEQPQLVLADIKMPLLNGVEAVKECVKIFPDLKFIFITAYDEFAVEAFRISAVDYIVKPIERNRLYQALERARKAIKANERSAEAEKPHKVLTIRFNRSIYYIPFKEILFIEKVDRRSVIHTLGKKYETYETLETLNERLDNIFYQTHRSFIVNLEHISCITASGKSYLAFFRGYQEYAQISKQKIGKVQELKSRLIMSS